jgi:hypothetical protein
MKSGKGGKITLGVEVTQIDRQGIWVLTDDKEYFLAFDRFPRFREATVGKIHNVQLVNNHELYWPDLKFKLSLELLGHPEEVPQFG